MGGCLDGWMDGWMDVYMDRWMSGCKDSDSSYRIPKFI